MIMSRTSIIFFISFVSILFFSSSAWSQEKKPYPPPGKLFDAGGHLLHLNIKGKGGPAVIFENGSGDFSFIWGLVQPSISVFTTSVSYDRAGFAWSEAGPQPRSSRQIAFELHTALKHAGIKGPYILVGQSFGGFLARAFARFYLEETAAMVLVDALHEDSKIIINQDPIRIREMAKGLHAPAPVLLKKSNQDIPSTPKDSVIMDTNIEYPLTRLPKKMQQWQVWAQSSTVYRREAGNEMNWSPEDVADLYKHQLSAQYRLGNIPLIVLTRGDGGYGGRADSLSLETERLKLQQKLAALSTNSKWIIDKKSGHNIHLEDPSLVIRSIREVFDAVKLHKKMN
jgi:pimeloyl-ACP methyl ester carboxylesterase